MIDFHVHISRGESGLLAAEALRYAALAGYRAVGLILRTSGDVGTHLPALADQVRQLSLYADVEAFLGVELVHVPPALLPDAVSRARQAGARLVLVHGETLAGQVAVGTNLAAVDAGADILAHPGLVDDQVAACAAEKGVALELTASRRHGLCNAHVAHMAEKFGCALVPGGNIRNSKDFVNRAYWDAVCRGAMMSDPMRAKLQADARELVRQLLTKKKAGSDEKARIRA